MMNFSDFDDWLKAFKDDRPYMTISRVVGGVVERIKINFSFPFFEKSVLLSL